jgi:hypothetical protein
VIAAIAAIWVVAMPAAVARAEPDAPRGDESLLPADGAVPGWRRAEPARVYSGPELYELIDGGAEIFFEHGFERVTVQRYALGADEVVVDLYAMRDAAAALGIYLGRCGEETPAPGLDLRHTAGRHELLAVKGRFYVVVESLSGSAERAADLVAFARALAPGLPAPEPVGALDLLPEQGRVPGSERLIRGPLALESFIQLGEGDVLQLGGRVTAAAASYQAPEGRFTLVVVPYADGAAARRAFAHVQAHLDPEIRPLSQAASHLVFRDYSGTYGEVLLDGTRIQLRLGLGERP